MGNLSLLLVVDRDSDMGNLFLLLVVVADEIYKAKKKRTDQNPMVSQNKEKS